MKMWTIYDCLIEGIPQDWIAEEVVCGRGFTYVTSRGSLGLAGTAVYDYRMPLFTESREGRPLREVAESIRSWNFSEASIGLAAVNAYYNHPETARQSGVPVAAEGKRVEDRVYDPFLMSQNRIRGKKVTVIGHFPFLESLFEPVCDLKILEAEYPQEGDYPLEAADYFLPESDLVFIGSGCVVEKTLPRYLSLSRQAERVTLVGPSTVLAPALFDFGVHDLSGLVVRDAEKAASLLRGASNGKIYSAAQKVSLRVEDLAERKNR